MKMRSLAAALLLCLGVAYGVPVQAQTFVVASCPSATTAGAAGQRGIPYAIDVNGNICSSSAGSGGLSVTDQAAWTQGSSAFTPNGGVFNDTATLSSGQQGTARLTTKRAMIVDVDTTGNQLHTDLTSPIPAGTNIIGKVGIDQTTPGTTNLVAITPAQAGVGATAAVVPANASYNGLNVGGNLVGQVGDPCQTVAKTYTPISVTTATTTRIVAPTASKKTYICQLFLTAAAADNVGVVEGTGGTCGTGTAGVIGGTTAANGPNIAANGGFSIGHGGFAVAATAGTNVDLCLITSAATPLAGTIAWVAQ